MTEATSNKEDILNNNTTISTKRELAPVWDDEDDETVVVNIKDATRLRKLRKTEEEAQVTGTEFQTRLQTQ